MQYHAQLIIADGACHCPVGGIRPFFFKESGSDDIGVTKQVLHFLKANNGSQRVGSRNLRHGNPPNQCFLGKYSNIKNELFKKDIEMILITILKLPLILTTTAVRRLTNTNFVDTFLRRIVLQHNVLLWDKKKKNTKLNIRPDLPGNYHNRSQRNIHHKFRCCNAEKYCVVWWTTYSEHTLKIAWRYAQDLTKSQKCESITVSPLWIQEMLAHLRTGRTTSWVLDQTYLGIITIGVRGTPTTNSSLTSLKNIA